MAEGVLLSEAQLAPTPEQQAAWARLVEAVETASRALKIACGTASTDVPGKFRRLEAGMEAELAAIRAIRPHLEMLYVALDTGQRARLDGLTKGRL